jgi:sarcosine oxidase subunit gamma
VATRRSPLAALLPQEITRSGLAFRDRTLDPRAGIRGRGVGAWLVENGYGAAAPPNRAHRLDSGLVVAMLGEAEALFLDRAGAVSLWLYGSGAPLAPDVYPTPRAEGTFWITVSGVTAPAMLATVCGVDLRRKAFADLQVAQTMIAKVPAIVIRDSGLGEEGFHVLADITLAAYIVRQLLDAADAASQRP